MEPTPPLSARAAHGFSLVEALVVLVIVSVLLAVALPHMGLHKRAAAQTRAKQDVMSLSDAMRACAAGQDGGSYLPCDLATVLQGEGNLADAVDGSASAGSGTGTGDDGGIRGASGGMACEPAAGKLCMIVVDSDTFTVVGRPSADDPKSPTYYAITYNETADKSCGSAQKGGGLTANEDCPTGRW